MNKTSGWFRSLFITTGSQESEEGSDSNLSLQTVNMQSKVRRTFGHKCFKFLFNQKANTESDDSKKSKKQNISKLSIDTLNHSRSKDTFSLTPEDSPNMQRSKSPAYHYNDRSSDSILLPDGRLVYGRSHTIDSNGFANGFLDAALISPISPLTVQQRAYYIAQSGQTFISTSVSSITSGPSVFVPDGGPKEAVVGRFTINRETVESSLFKPASLERKSSRFSPQDR